MGNTLRYDFTGQICGCWKVIERDWNPISKSHETFWKCECQRCGNIASVRSSDLKENPQSCNRCKGEFIQNTMQEKGLTFYNIGEKFGMLTIIGRDRVNKRQKLICKCDCGNIKIIDSRQLKWRKDKGATRSCGCLRMSNGELKIKQILEKSNVKFQQEYIIPELSKLLSFDFAIFDNNNQLIKLIEFDGEQHFKAVEWFGGEESLKKQQKRDQRKNDYCKEHNIELLRIPYNKYNEISLDMLIG